MTTSAEAAFTAADHAHMARALRLARQGLWTAHPNPRVGCVLVRGEEIVGEGYHRRTGEAHAEVAALEAAGPAARGATAYVTLEPCSHKGRTPPCTRALIDAGVTRVVAAMREPSAALAGAGLAALDDAGVATAHGLLAEQALALNPGFVSRMRRRRPWVRVKSAVGLDGRTAMGSGESQWITGAAARADVQRWRARSSAVLTGSGTVLADDPRLTARIGAEGETVGPLRVVLDSRFRTPPQAQLLAAGGEVLILGAADREPPAALRATGARLATVSAGAGGVALGEVMECLTELEINEVQVEAGAGLVGALFDSGLVDELLLYQAPHLMGDGGPGIARLRGLERMRDRLALDWREVRVVGDDLRLSALTPAGAELLAGRT